MTSLRQDLEAEDATKQATALLQVFCSFTCFLWSTELSTLSLRFDSYVQRL